MSCHTGAGEAESAIVESVVAMSTTHRTTVTGEDTDLLILLLHHSGIDNKDIYFRSDKGKPIVYDIRGLTTCLGDDASAQLSFAHAFTGSDTTSRIFGVGKESLFQKIIMGHSGLQAYAKIFSDSKSDCAVVKSAGCEGVIV